jgi:hypothetical protein
LLTDSASFDIVLDKDPKSWPPVMLFHRVISFQFSWMSCRFVIME